MAQSATRRRATRPPQRQLLAKAPGRDRMAPGSGPGGGFSTLSLMPETSPGGIAAMSRGPGTATAMASTHESTSDAAEPVVVEAAQSKAVVAAAGSVSAVVAKAQAAVMPDMAKPEADSADAAASQAATPEIAEMAAPEVAETEAAAEVDLEPAETGAGASPQGAASEVTAAEGGGEAAPPGEAEEEAPPEPPPAKAVAPAARAVGKRAAKSATHQPAAAAADGAIKASNRKPVTQDRMAQDASMKDAEKAKTGKVDTSAFEAMLRRAIAEAIPEPKSEREAKDVMRYGGERAAKKVGAGLQEQKTNAVGDLPGKVGEGAVPDASGQPAPEEVPLVPEEAGAPPEPVSAGPMVPPPSTEAAIDTSANRDGVDQLQADNKITKEQLEKGNDPDMTATLTARDAAEKHDREAPKQLREAEAADRANTRAQADGKIKQGLSGFHGERVSRLGKVAAAQTNTKGLAETRKQEITDAIQSIADQTRTDVTQILIDMDAKVEADFREAINKAMEDYDAAFKEEKGGILTRIGDALSGDWWGTDRLEKALRAGRNAFDRHISAAITTIATYVEQQLTTARDRVKKGRDEVEEYMTTKVTDAEREFAEGAAGTITADFDALEGDIAAAKDALVTKMVGIYKEGIERRNKREKELREANKPFWQKVWDATVGVIKKIIEFKNMLLGILARAAAVVEAIIQDPIGFLKNLIAGIAAGLNRFVANIGENLKKALMGWLFGALEGAGLKPPEKFDLMGFLNLVLQVLGLTKENVRARAVRILGEETVVAIETAVDFIKVLFKDGPAALWQMLLEKLGDIKEVILAEIRSWVITKVIEAGIKWIIGLMNPAGAFIKACMMIYDIVVFFIERGRQIIEAVNAIINTLAAIVSGNISAMAQAVEGALNRILPVVISFLASLLGLGGISDTIRNFIEAVQKPVNAAIDWIIHQGVAIAKKIGGLFGGKKDKKKDEEDDQASDPEVQAKIDQGLLALDQENAKVLDGGALSVEEAQGVAARVKRDHPVFKSIDVVTEGDEIDYAWSANPKGKRDGGENEEGYKPTPQEVDRAKVRAIKEVREDDGLDKMLAERAQKYEEDFEEKNKGIVADTREDAMAVSHLMGQKIAKGGSKELKSTKRPINYRGTEVSISAFSFGKEKSNVNVRDADKKRKSYAEERAEIASLAQDMGMSAARFDEVRRFHDKHGRMHPDYAGTALGDALKRRLDSLSAIREFSEHLRSDTGLVHTAMGDFEAQEIAKRRGDADIGEDDIAPITTGLPEAAESGGAQAMRMADDAITRPDDMRDKLPGPKAKGREAIDAAIAHHRSATDRQIAELLKSDYGKNMKNEDDLKDAIVLIIIGYVLGGEYD